MLTADGCEGLPEEAEASLRRAFRTSKHGACLRAEWQEGGRAGWRPPGLVCPSALSAAAGRAPLPLLNPGPLLPAHPPRSSPLGPLLGLCPRSQPTTYTQTRIHTLPEASELTHNSNSGARAPFLAHNCDPSSTLGLVLCFKGLFSSNRCLALTLGCVRKGALEVGPRSLAEARRRERASGRRSPGWQPSQIQGWGPGLHRWPSRGAAPCKSELCGESLRAEGTQVLCHLIFTRSAACVLGRKKRESLEGKGEQ